jgi:hypothetical protein
MKVKLTDRFCTNVKSGTRMEYFDEDTTGLALRVTEQGSKSWTYNYTLGDKRVRMTLGLPNHQPCWRQNQSYRSSHRA